MNMSDVKVKITRNGVVDFDSEKQSDYITTPSGKRHKISKKEFVVNIFRNNKLSYTNSKENKVVYQEKSNNTVKESFDYKNKYHKPKFGGYVNNNKSVFQEENKEEPKKLISDEDIAKATSNYVKKEEYTGSMNGMRYMLKKKVVPRDDQEETCLEVIIWPEPYGYARTEEEKKLRKDFPFSEDGLKEAVVYLNQQFEDQRVLWDLSSKLEM